MLKVLGGEMQDLFERFALTQLSPLGSNARLVKSRCCAGNNSQIQREIEGFNGAAVKKKKKKCYAHEEKA